MVQEKVLSQMVLRFDSSKWPVDLWFAQSGQWVAMRSLCIHLHCAVKVAVLTATSVSNLDVMPCPVTSSSNPEVMSVCDLLARSPKVTSLGNPDVTSHPLHQISCWISPATGVTGQPATQYQSQWHSCDQIDDGCVGLSNRYICS